METLILLDNYKLNEEQNKLNKEQNKLNKEQNKLNKELHNDIENILLNGRQYNITNIICIENMMDINNDIKHMIDYVFLFKNTNYSKLLKIYNTYGGYFFTITSFITVFEELTNENRCMVIILDNKSQKLKDTIKWFNI